jgi:hypothetical protein
MSFIILRNPVIEPAIFGIFGGGGRSGSLIRGSDGRSGRSGRVGSHGSIGNPGNLSDAESEPMESDGSDGSRIGEILGIKLGIDTLIPSRISERSSTISGHFGNLITGIDGMSMERSLNFQYWRLLRSLRQTPQLAVVSANRSSRGCQLSAIALIRTKSSAHLRNLIPLSRNHHPVICCIESILQSI